MARLSSKHERDPRSLPSEESDKIVVEHSETLDVDILLEWPPVSLRRAEMSVGEADRDIV